MLCLLVSLAAISLNESEGSFSSIARIRLRKPRSMTLQCTCARRTFHGLRSPPSLVELRVVVQVRRPLVAGRGPWIRPRIEEPAIPAVADRHLALEPRDLPVLRHLEEDPPLDTKPHETLGDRAARWIVLLHRLTPHVG
jgi:hypothetical protein